MSRLSADAVKIMRSQIDTALLSASKTSSTDITAALGMGVRLCQEYTALEAKVTRLEQERHWAAQFHCSNCGVIGAEYVTTKKTCAHCDPVSGGTGEPHHLVRSKHPYVQELEAEITALRTEVAELLSIADGTQAALDTCQRADARNAEALAAAGRLGLKWEYEDEIEGDLTTEMYRASVVDVVRIYPFIERDDEKFYLHALRPTPDDAG